MYWTRKIGPLILKCQNLNRRFTTKPKIYAFRCPLKLRIVDRDVELGVDFKVLLQNDFECSLLERQSDLQK